MPLEPGVIAHRRHGKPLWAEYLNKQPKQNRKQRNQPASTPTAPPRNRRDPPVAESWANHFHEDSVGDLTLQGCFLWFFRRVVLFVENNSELVLNELGSSPAFFQNGLLVTHVREGFLFLMSSPPISPSSYSAGHVLSKKTPLKKSKSLADL